MGFLSIKITSYLFMRLLISFQKVRKSNRYLQTISSFGISIWTKKFSKVRATIAEGLNNHNNKSKILGCRFLEQGHFSNCVTLTSINKKVPIYPRKMIGYYILWAAKWGTNHYCGMHRSGVICIQKKFIQLFSFKL